MARLPRLALAGHTHCIIQRGHSQRLVFVDAEDRQAYLRALREAAHAEQVQVHAYALLNDEVQLLVTPAQASALGRLVQAVGRRYVSAYNRRHGGHGTLWAGRFRSGVLQPGPDRLEALLLLDGLSHDTLHTSAAHHLGAAAELWLFDLPEFWQLGNTPFEREAAYARLLAQRRSVGAAERLRQAVMSGWALGSAAFVAQIEQQSARPARPLPRGRPRTKPGNEPRAARALSGAD
jgi:putative transposase